MLIGTAATDAVVVSRIRGTSPGSTSRCILDLTSRADDPVDVIVPRGTQFVPDSVNHHVVVSTSDAFARVPPRGSASLRLVTVSGSAYGFRSPPADGRVSYAVATDLSPVLSVMDEVAALRPQLEPRAKAIDMPVDRYAESVVQYAIWRLFDAPPATPQCGCRASVEVVPQAAEAGTLHLVPGDEPVRWELVAVDEQTVELVAVLADERPLLARRYRASFTPRCDAEARWASPTYGWDMRASIGLVTLRATATAELTCPGHPARTWSVTGDFSIALERVPGRVAVTVSPGTTVGVRLTTGDFDESYRIAARAANDVALWSSPRRVEAHVAPGPASPDDHTFSVDDLSGEACNAVRRTWQQLAAETATYDQLDVTQAWQSLRDAGVPGLTTPAETITELETQLRAVIATVKP